MVEKIETERYTLYLGDCLDVPADDLACDAVVTDPPYEGMKGGTVINHAGVCAQTETTTTIGKELGDWSALAEIQKYARLGTIAFCSFHKIEDCAALIGGTRKGLVTWFKRNSPYSVNNAPWFMTEFAWAVQYAPGIDWRTLRTMIDVPMLQAGCMASERIVKGGKAVHPAQKPIAVMLQLILPGMEIVCDPYMGTGTTGVACMKLGRRFIGVERDPAYFAIAAKRIAKAAEEPPLFKTAREAEQAELAFAKPMGDHP